MNLPNTVLHSNVAWYKDFDKVAVVLLLLFLLCIAGSLLSVAMSLHWRPQSEDTMNGKAKVLVGSEQKAEAGAKNALRTLLAGQGLSEAEMDLVSKSAAQQIIKDIVTDRTGQTARRFGEFIRDPSAPSDANGEKTTSDAVLPYIKNALKTGASTLGAKTAQVEQKAESITTDALSKVADGFLGGMGELPWSIAMQLIGNAFDKNPEIKVKCTCCECNKVKDANDESNVKCDGDREAGIQIPKPDKDCPKPQAGAGSCASVVLPKAEIRFFSNADAVDPDQAARLDGLLAALRSNESIALLRAHADRKASELYNYRLTQRRGEAVRETLVSQGVAPERIFVAAMGEKGSPVSTKDNVARAENRVVWIEVRSNAVASPLP